MSLRDRKPAIRKLANNDVIQVVMTKNGIPTEFRVPGSKSGSWYYVAIPSEPCKEILVGNTPYEKYSCTCRECSDPYSFPPCLGNSHSETRRDTVCKHSIAALIRRFEWQQMDVKICDWSENGHDIDNAKRVLRMGGQLIKLVSNQGDGQVWLVAVRKQPEDTVRLDDNTILTGCLAPAPNDPLPVTKDLTLEQRNNLMRHPEDDYID